MSFWDDDLRRLMDEALVPGAALAIVRDGQIAELASYGARGVQSPAAVDEHTVFDAASLSKPVFAYLVLQLVGQGKLHLNAPLGDSIPGYIPADPRSSSMTAEHVLSHSSGLPNWRNPDYPLRTHFNPGERFSYSGEGFLYLQRAAEHITGEKLEALARKMVFEPLEMGRSSFVWEARFHDNRAHPHDAFGIPALGNKPAEANAAWSLQTCAADYGRFLIAVLDGVGLSSDLARLWLMPHVEVKHKGAQFLGPSTEDVATGVAWGLGWGLEPGVGTFFHWGDNGPFTAYTIGSLRDRAALAVFTNGASGFSLMHEIVARFTAGARPSLAWLDHPRHDSPVRRALRAALTRGVETAWPEIEGHALKREQLVWIAQGLNVRGRVSDSLWLRARLDEKASQG